jgi:hypothetical protein
MISANDLLSMQATANAAGDTSIVIKRMTPTKDSTGHFSEAWNTVTTVTGNMAQPSPAQMQNYEYKVGVLNAWLVRVPVGTSILENDELVTGGLTLRVQIVLVPQSYPTCIQALASVIT